MTNSNDGNQPSQRSVHLSSGDDDIGIYFNGGKLRVSGGAVSSTASRFDPTIAEA